MLFCFQHIHIFTVERKQGYFAGSNKKGKYHQHKKQSSKYNCSISFYSNQGEQKIIRKRYWCRMIIQIIWFLLSIIITKAGITCLRCGYKNKVFNLINTLYPAEDHFQQGVVFQVFLVHRYALCRNVYLMPQFFCPALSSYRQLLR